MASAYVPTPKDGTRFKPYHPNARRVRTYSDGIHDAQQAFSLANRAGEIPTYDIPPLTLGELHSIGERPVKVTMSEWIKLRDMSKQQLLQLVPEYDIIAPHDDIMDIFDYISRGEAYKGVIIRAKQYLHVFR